MEPTRGDVRSQSTVDTLPLGHSSDGMDTIWPVSCNGSPWPRQWWQWLYQVSVNGSLMDVLGLTLFSVLWQSTRTRSQDPLSEVSCLASVHSPSLLAMQPSFALKRWYYCAPRARSAQSSLPSSASHATITIPAGDPAPVGPMGWLLANRSPV